MSDNGARSAVVPDPEAVFGRTELPSVRYRKTPHLVVGWVAFLLTVALVVTKLITSPASPVNAVYVALAIWVGVQLLLALSDRPRGNNAGARSLSVAALVPVYNEDPAALWTCLRGLLEQKRPLQAIVVTDDGSSDDIDYTVVRTWFEKATAAAGVRGTWIVQENRGKRFAQMAGARAEPDVDIYLTVDSDSILDVNASAQALRAFADPKVMSVAAVILSTNYRSSLIARMMDLYTVGLQLFERSAFSAVNSVLVNSGGCAYYRASVLWDNRETYLSETLFGKPVHFSDDSMLTLFALMKGKAVQQQTAYAFTLMPQDFSHHRRQQLRWMRGSFIRSGWRMRFLPFNRPAYWLHLVKWFFYATVTATLFVLLFSGRLGVETIVTGTIAGFALYIMTIARYVAVIRSDQSTAQRWLTFATAPLTLIWSFTFLRVLRWYAMLTIANLGWNTRESIEVTAT